MEHKRQIQVHENHKRAITSALWLLDEMLCEFEQYARDRERHSVLYHEKNRLSAKQKKQLLCEIETMKMLLCEVKDVLDLNKKVESITSKIQGKCSCLWVILVETTSKYLVRYGDIPSELAKFLDPIMEQFIEHLLRLSEIVRNSSDYGQPAVNYDDKYV